MWTPRSVASQNKDFMVHIKYGSHKSTLKLNKDSTIDQLKQKISQELNIHERDLGLTINGKPCHPQGNLTLSQARVQNNSKILVSTSSVGETLQHTSAAYSHDAKRAKSGYNTKRAESSYDTKRAESSDNSIDAQLDTVKAKGQEISQTVKSLEDRASQLKNYRGQGQEYIEDIKVYKKTAAMQGEQLMQNFEKLDRLNLENMEQQKRKRKEIANLLNSVLDRNDQVIAALTQYLKSKES